MKYVANTKPENIRLSCLQRIQRASFAPVATFGSSSSTVKTSQFLA
jgi:hypothetical protein